MIKLIEYLGERPTLAFFFIIGLWATSETIVESLANVILTLTKYATGA